MTDQGMSAFELARAADLAERGRLAEAETAYRRLISGRPEAIETRLRLVELLRRQGKRIEAVVELRAALDRSPGEALVLELLAKALAEMGRRDEAELAYRDAIAASPGKIAIRIALAVMLKAHGKLEASLQAYLEAVELAPDSYGVHYNLANLLREMGRLDAAVLRYRGALEIDPRSADALFNLALTLRSMGRTREAVQTYRRLVEVHPNHARGWNNLATCLRTMFDVEGAEAALNEAIRLDPNYADAYYNLGNVLVQGERLREAGVAYRNCLQRNPNYHQACFEAGKMLMRLVKQPEAEKAFRRAVQLNPGSVEYREELAGCLRLQGKFDEAAGVCRGILLDDPENAEALAVLCDMNEIMCDWRGRDEDFARLNRVTARQIAAGKRTALTSFRALARPMSEAEQVAVAKTWAGDTAERMAPKRARLGFTFRHAPHERVRIGYISQDFRNQAMGHLTRSMYAMHDRSRFEIFAYSVRADDDSRYRRDIAAGCDHFNDVAGWPATDIARRIHADEIDILVDMMGYTEGNRMVVMALRPAPIQVGYLRFPGSSGASFIDYMLTDPVVTPPSSEPFYAEKLVRLPHCYQVNDHEQRTPDTPVSRTKEGLPEDAFVYCCFNNSYKIEPSMFDVWMRVLKAVPDSVLWLLRIRPEMEPNLKREAADRGIDPDRIVFSGKVAKLRHLARHRLADLFLDTRYYTAHTTASDALVAGIPIITYPGDTFASRVTASMLKAIGLEELILPTLEAYEATAIAIGRDPARIAALKAKVDANRPVTPLFDTARWVRNVERAYGLIWDNHMAGNPPRQMDVVED
jgi:predicted O-linked N-acetylglucosamine transferase (SPINDLY family)